MNQESSQRPNDIDASRSADCSHAIIYNEETVGRLLRRLNLVCVKAWEASDAPRAAKAAEFSRTVEQAMRFAGLIE